MTVRIELQCNVCRSAYFKVLSETIEDARARAVEANWSAAVTTRGLIDICPRCSR